MPIDYFDIAMISSERDPIAGLVSILVRRVGVRLNSHGHDGEIGRNQTERLLMIAGITSMVAGFKDVALQARAIEVDHVIPRKSRGSRMLRPL